MLNPERPGPSGRFVGYGWGRRGASSGTGGAVGMPRRVLPLWAADAADEHNKRV